MTDPRYVVEDSYCFVTRRCAQRKFLLKPSKQANEAFEYCLAQAAAVTGVEVLFAVVLSNHYHLGLYDPDGETPRFMRELNRLVAKHHNTMYDRRENLFSTDKYSLVRLESPIDVVRRLIYTLDNPVKANLVEKARHWPGVISLPEQLGTTKIVKRPELFFRKDGTMPEAVELTFHKPRCFSEMSDQQYREWIGKMLEQRETLRREQRRVDGIKVLGRKAVLAQHHEDAPKTPREKLFADSPRIGAADKWKRIEAIQRLKTFLAEYRECWKAWAEGDRSVVFPVGTYLMRRLHRCMTCAPPLPAPA